MNSQNTVNSIYSYQNDEFLLLCQLAQRSKYRKAKNISESKKIIIIVFGIIAVVASIINLDWLTALNGMLAVVLLIASKYMDRASKKHQIDAASIQQHIDVTLYNHVFPLFPRHTSTFPLGMDILNAIANEDKSEVDSVRNWYCDYSSYPPQKQVFFCQCENARWSRELHIKYKNFLLLIYGMLVLFLITALFFSNPTLVDVLCVISYLTPLIEFIYSTNSEINESLKLQESLTNFCQKNESKINKPDVESVSALHNIQNQIYNARLNGYLIPDWFYEKNNNELQTNANNLAELLGKQNHY